MRQTRDDLRYQSLFICKLVQSLPVLKIVESISSILYSFPASLKQWDGEGTTSSLNHTQQNKNMYTQSLSPSPSPGQHSPSSPRGLQCNITCILKCSTQSNLVGYGRTAFLPVRSNQNNLLLGCLYVYKSSSWKIMPILPAVSYSCQAAKFSLTWKKDRCTQCTPKLWRLNSSAADVA